MCPRMGIKGLSKVIADIAPGSIKSGEMKVNFKLSHLTSTLSYSV